jgi:spermidine/putrescine transport system substrate-binding protein
MKGKEFVTRNTGKTIQCLVVFFIVLMVLLVSSIGSFASDGEEERELSIFTWEGYVPEDMRVEFENETGITVRVTYFAENGECISKMRATGGEGYDLVQPTFNQVADAQKAFGIYQPIDFSKLKVMDNIIPSLARGTKEATTIDGKQYSIPQTWGTVGLIVNTNRIKKGSYSYMDLYDDKYCGRVSTRYTWFTFAGAAYGQGYDFFGAYGNESEYRNLMEEMLEFLISKKPCIRTYWTTRQEQLDLMTSEECWISQGWDGTGFFLNKENPHIKFYCPKEGALGWIDTFTISAGAENIDEAYEWINWMLTKERGAQIIDKTGYLSAVKGAVDLLPADRKKVLNDAYPPEDVDNINWYAPLVSYINEINSIMEEKLKVAK